MTESESGARARRSVSEVSSSRSLRKIDNAQAGGAAHFTRAQSQFAGHGAQQGGFAGPVGPTRPSFRPAVRLKVTSRRISRSPSVTAALLHFDQPFGLALGGVEGDAGRKRAAAGFGVLQLRNERVGVVDAGLCLGGAGFGAAAQPLNLGAHAVAQALLDALLPTRSRLRGLPEISSSCLSRAAVRRDTCG